MDWEEELLPPPLSLLGEGEGTVEEERRGQSSRCKVPGMDGRHVAVMGVGLVASWVEDTMGFAMEMELVAAGAMEFRRGP